MSRKDKLIERITSKPKDFTWNELSTLLTNLGFVDMSTGKTGGSRRKFYHVQKNRIVNLHKPHPKPILKAYAIIQVIKILEEEGLI